MNAPVLDPKRLEALGPAERAIQTLTTYTDHCQHSRPGYVCRDASAIGTTWTPCTWKQEKDAQVVYRKTKFGRKEVLTRVGVLDGLVIKDGARVVGDYRKPGLYPEAVAWMYRQIADIWKVDNDFSAHLASWAYGKDHRDLKVILAAFMLVQNRAGEPVLDNGKVAFLDEDYRDVGEAMLLLRSGKTGFDPKLMLRVGEVLELPQVAALNREFGFGKSARSAFLGRYPKAVEKWLRSLEHNPKLLKELVKKGWRTTVMALARKVGYKPITPAFFQVLRWKQKQAVDGRRTLAIGEAVSQAESWVGLSEAEICQRIVDDKPNYKRLVGMLPADPGLTRAVMAAAIEAKCLSDTDLIILVPTLEDLGLLEVTEVKAAVEAALAKADNQRAANIARNVKSTKTAETLVAAADKATAKAMEEVTRGLRVYVVVDKSGSMSVSLEAAKRYLTKFLGGFPLDRCHVSVFNTMGTEITLKGQTSVAVEHAFRGHSAGGGTIHSTGVEVLLQKYVPLPDEDALVIFVGDGGEYANGRLAEVFRRYGVAPVAFVWLQVPGENAGYISAEAVHMGIPCFMIEEGLFNDPYTITRTLRNLIASTPVSKGGSATTPRVNLLGEILNTPLLTKPQWA